MKHIILYIFIFFIAKFSSAQTLSCEQIETNLRTEYSKILYFHDKHDYDSLEIQNKIVLDLTIFYTSLLPQCMDCPFKNLDFSIITSEDSSLRIYSWDTWTGGTMHFFENVYQYKQNDKIYSKYFEDKDTANYSSGTYFSEIYNLKNNNKTYYLAIQNGIYSSKDCGQYIKIFTIENEQLNDTVKLIKTKTGIRNKLGFEYDFFSVVDRPERPLKLITYDSLTKTINIPVVRKDGKVTNKFIHYKFTGEYFEKVNMKKPK